ncbi:carbamoyl-phosphate synthase (glutamine-hydrolyzing) large subunit [Patescibacteria group bacterium]|nr:carbamoyl-phosphate synthase (glutamine-hydrolyzing) large subunit [Patescibacteria group bacterium]MBU0963891.1 carbamoyl-phosphate synthase (glutamine-hydrolyzing) large subunit [Patescibacteria group bacterium]
MNPSLRQAAGYQEKRNSREFIRRSLKRDSLPDLPLKQVQGSAGSPRLSIRSSSSNCYCGGRASPRSKLRAIRRRRIKKVIILGSGALKIGEAGEFDYSGSQALKALKEEGIKTILINPNVATIQTSENIADTIYFLPVTPYFVEKVIKKERPDGILLAFGGQTALNCGVELFNNKILKKYKVKVIGTPVKAIINTEDRHCFVKRLAEINVSVPKSIAVTNLEQAKRVAKKIGYPIIIRAAYTLGGQGSGFADSEQRLTELASQAFSYTHQILIEESLEGWKEIEYEVVRDKYDNCITVCNMENFDPLGIHTGESIVVAPSQTLNNKEYHKLRHLSIKVIKHLGIIGECNIQFTLDPTSEDYRVIEVNARLSRSSALASKATGYPLAFIAAKLGLGYSLSELKNSVTKSTTACFEPALDYIVCKIPRWDLGKFKLVAQEIGSSMKSVGEVMAIGRNFEEVIQKALRMVGLGMHGFVGNNSINLNHSIEKELTNPTDRRIFAIEQAFKRGFSVEKISNLTKIDKWFLFKLKNIIDTEKELKKINLIQKIPKALLLRAKQQGFSDFQIARSVLKDEKGSMDRKLLKVRAVRKKLAVLPFVKQIDTLAAEYPAKTNYLYLTYDAQEHDIEFKKQDKPVIVLGSGAYRIGSSVEFDWCCVNAVLALAKKGYKTVMINYNPETVSTDYDICDKLFFDELTFERVLDIYELEKPQGVIVSMGGQIPNNLAIKLYNQKVKILGTSPVSIDNAEDRHKFSKLLDELAVDQPEWKELSNLNEIHKFANDVGYPVLIRPSYVLSGAAMHVVTDPSQLNFFLKMAVNISKKYPVVVSKFIIGAKEIEIDAVARNGKILCYALSEHVEHAGVHSGDATIVFPPQKTYLETVRRIKKITRQIASRLKISGPFNIQFLAKENDIKVIECNLRASRSFPFVSKVLKVNFIELATRVMLGEKVKKSNKSLFELDYVSVKAPQFSFTRLQGADPILGVEMASTGEVACLGDDFHEALLKSMISVGWRFPKKNILLSTGPVESKAELLDSIRELERQKYTLYATRGTAQFLKRNGVNSKILFWPNEKKEPNTKSYIKEKKIDLVINIPKNYEEEELSNDYIIRRTAVDFNVPLLTNTRLAKATVDAICKKSLNQLTIKSWNEYN